MSFDIFQRCAKWFENKDDPSIDFVWYWSNFNMPVPDLPQGSITKTEWFTNAISEQYTYDLSWFRYWWEILAADSVVVVEDESAIDIVIKEERIHKDWSTMFTTNSWTLSIPDTTWTDPKWYTLQIMSNQWLAPWEIDQDGTYSYKTIVEDTGWNILASKTTNFDIINTPNFPLYKLEGYMRINWTILHYTDANWFEWKIEWDFVSVPSSSIKWAVWIDHASGWKGELHYIDEDWDERKVPWHVQQFDSSFSNWPTKTVSGETPGYFWVDDEFWQTHIWIIMNDGYKNLVGDGSYPY